MKQAQGDYGPKVLFVETKIKDNDSRPLLFSSFLNRLQKALFLKIVPVYRFEPWTTGVGNTN